MADRQNRMVPNHAGAGIAHGRLDAPAHFRVVAMHRTFVADWLPAPERALGDPLLRIRQKPGAIGTQILFRAMVGAAVDSDHGRDGSGFEVHEATYIEYPVPLQD